MAYEDYIDQIARNVGQSPQSQAFADTIYGINITGRGSPIPLNTENHGYTFFTRPDLNLSYDNCQVDRVLSNVLMSSPRSLQRVIRSYLDPQAQRAPNGPACPLVDPLNPFIPLLSNNLVTITGWPDFTLGTYSSQPGLYREVYSYVDDVPYDYSEYDLQVTTRNLTGDPITLMLLIWGRYEGLVKEGRIMPHPFNVMNDVIDYNTRIYRLVMDPTRTYVTRLMACGASYPISAPIGRHADYTGEAAETPFQTATEQLTFTFRTLGFTYYDHILIYEFNTCVSDANPAMADEHREEGGDTSSPMVKLKSWERSYFSGKAYPRIEPATMELEWWVPRRVYTENREGVIRFNNTQGTPTTS